jgi:penicillin-binding protein 2
VADLAFEDTLKGAVIAIDPRNGEVLLMMSNPSVDPNIFSMSTSLRSKNWGTIATDPNLPLNNRAIGGTYTPGSTFKLVSSLSGLESDKLTKDSHMPAPCHGSYRIGSRLAHCWNARGHGSLNLIGAVQQSCNVYFYQVGLRLGDRVINKYAQMLGLGAVSGIDLPGERAGWLSGEDAYNKRWASRNWKWTKGLVLDLAIGQTQVVTPIQLALMVGGLANSHAIYKPFLVKEERSEDGAVLRQVRSELKSTLNFQPVTEETMTEALESVIKAGGTGGRAAVPGVPVGGKTGSAENPQGDLTHALFVAAAPVKNPVIAIAVVVENAGHGGSIAAPIAGEILRYFFAETEEGKKVVEELNPGNTKVVEQLQNAVAPMKAKLAATYPVE